MNDYSGILQNQMLRKFSVSSKSRLLKRLRHSTTNNAIQKPRVASRELHNLEPINQKYDYKRPQLTADERQRKLYNE